MSSRNTDTSGISNASSSVPQTRLGDSTSVTVLIRFTTTASNPPTGKNGIDPPLADGTDGSHTTADLMLANLTKGGPRLDTLSPDATQMGVFEKYRDDIDTAIASGTHMTIIAYGTTGSGKTFTMTGPPSPPQSMGLARRIGHHILQQAKSRGVGLEALFVYRDKVYDLLHAKPLHEIDVRTHEAKTRGGASIKVFRAQASTTVVKNQGEFEAALSRADKNKVVAATTQNSTGSSRGHTVLSLALEGTTTSCVLVDLAGSEKPQRRTGIDRNSKAEMQKNRLDDEGRFIRIQLMEFYKFVSGFAKSVNDGLIHARGSVLNQILTIPIVRSARLHLICTISLKHEDMENASATIDFARKYQKLRPIGIREARKTLKEVRSIVPPPCADNMTAQG
ncbi:hypothetical protein IAR55_007200 [Kwoniella newhampshirensis]|uniref:Kinesin motor domain-containing protein n=1 Tax=Kwoniella newhampshirensis TaxID=1651941 RepID=A0AAW0YFQ3_9TREE